MGTFGFALQTEGYDYAAELDIVWVVSHDEAVQLPSVRERLCGGYSGKPRLMGRLPVVAYAVRKRDKKRFPQWGRRVWFLDHYDQEPAGPRLGKLIDPRTIEVGQPTLPVTVVTEGPDGKLAKKQSA